MLVGFLRVLIHLMRNRLGKDNLVANAFHLSSNCYLPVVLANGSSINQVDNNNESYNPKTFRGHKLGRD